MINLSDPLDRLRAANPVLLSDPSIAGPDPALFHRITTIERVPAPRPHLLTMPGRRRRPSPRLVPVLAVLGLLGGATAYALLRGDVAVPQVVACYERADLRSDAQSASVDESGPVAACLALWQKGAFDNGAEVPPLASCVLDAGLVGVFPNRDGGDICATLLLPPVAPSAPPTTGSGPDAPPPADPTSGVFAFREAVTAQFNESCVEGSVAAAIVRRELDRAGLRTWTVRIGEGLAGAGFSAERPCASLSLRPDLGEVVLVPMPRR